MSAAREIESDICIVGSGITAALMAEKLAAERDVTITVVEAGGHTTPLRERALRRARWQQYGETPWPNDHVDDQNALGTAYGFSPSMNVGGLAMHWGGVTPRFSPEDFRLRTLYGVGDDWPISYEELDPFYQEAEERMGIAGEQGPPEMDPRGKPFPMPALPLSQNLQLLREWAGKAGVTMWGQPSAKNSVPYAGRASCQRCDTCYPICPTGAKYSPDFSFDALVRAGRVRLETETLVRRIHADARTGRITHLSANSTRRPGETVEFRARSYVLAAGFTWTPHLLLLSSDARFPDGIANRSGLVGKYLCGHRNVAAQIQLPLPLFPGVNAQHSLVTKQFMRPGALARYMRHDLRVWESSFGQEPRFKDASGGVLLGDAMLAEWRSRARRGVARVRAYYDVLPARESELRLDPTVRNAWGDPMPRLAFRDAPESVELRGPTEQAIRELFARMARAGDGTIVSSASAAGDIGQEHPGGGCRMGTDGATSVVDRDGRAHDHENLFIAGAPTMVTASCCNGTLTFGALGLMTAARVGRDFPARA
ncbi:MAG: GMC family oxidoreductase [Gemmatimonadales bacterium]|nr:GMC family oxidoreductase [Gemmatimonadota bacterium]MCL4214920.1 GMC family oxidoreductase [Gemmatimonadales bacterium]